MSSAQPPTNPDDPNERSGEPENPGSVTQEIRHSQVSARVPEQIGRGVFSTGAIVLQGPQEFVIDFILRVTHPFQVISRVVMSPVIMPRMIAALRENLNKYEQNFGPPQNMPQGPKPAKAPTIEEIYDQLKLPDEQLSGVYANAVMITHSPAEFCFDFITNFYPRSAVSCRVYMAVAQVPRLLETLGRSFQQYQQKLATQKQQPPPEPPPPTAVQ